MKSEFVKEKYDGIKPEFKEIKNDEKNQFIYCNEP